MENKEADFAAEYKALLKKHNVVLNVSVHSTEWEQHIKVDFVEDLNYPRFRYSPDFTIR